MFKAALIGAVDESAEKLSNFQKSVAPVSHDDNPGQLRDSHRYTLSEGGLKATIMAGGAEAPHAKHVEHGTKEIEPHSWFYPAYRLMKRDIRRNLSRAVTKVVRFWNQNSR